MCLFFFFQAEDGIRDGRVTGVQTCALPIYTTAGKLAELERRYDEAVHAGSARAVEKQHARGKMKIGRASCRERGEISGGGGSLKKKKKREGGRREENNKTGGERGSGTRQGT